MQIELNFQHGCYLILKFILENISTIYLTDTRNLYFIIINSTAIIIKHIIGFYYSTKYMLTS